MFNRSVLFIVVALFALPAFAQQSPGQTDAQLFADGVSDLAARRLSDNLGSRSNNAPLKFANASSTAVPVLNLNASNDAYLFAPTGQSVVVGVGATPVPFDKFGPASVPTMAATPVAGTNILYPGLNVVPTAAANTAAFIGAATPVVGQRFIVNNAAGATVRLKAAGGATLNGATAGGYIALVSLATVECFTASATNQVCLQPVIPTPAGP